jgi:serine/threonine-protein kinase
MRDPEQLERLFHEARKLAHAERTIFLADACGPDSVLFRDVSLLLAAHDDYGDEDETSDADVRLTPGTVLGRRYKIVSWIKRGGMGEVYKAEDLRFGRTVALKFLPDSVAASPVAVARLYREASLATQVSHKNVCRIHDLCDADGLLFLTMQYIDGDDLGAILHEGRRPARFDELEVARQICFGLAAVHGAGILHRDLKPGNVMIDHQGHASLTDFGIAAAARDVSVPALQSVGTLPYMAPELFTRASASKQSDIYSLGLLLYELFTGRRVVPDATPTEIVDYHGSRPDVVRPSAIMPGLSPLVDEAILWCLRDDPFERPASALQVARALPGGADLLQIVVDAGETPPPELVDEAAGSARISAPLAWGLWAVVVGGLVASMTVSDRLSIVEQTRFPMSPAALASKARDTLARLGYRELPGDSAFGFLYDAERLEYTTRHHNRGPSPILFWYREGRAVDHSLSLEPPPDLVDADARQHAGGPSAVLFWYRTSQSIDRSPTLEGLADLPDVGGLRTRTVTLDVSGRLVSLDGAPDALDRSRDHSSLEWQPLAEAAGLDPVRFTRTAPSATPIGSSDQTVAWSGSFRELPDIPMRVEAVARRGLPLSLGQVGPWTGGSRAESRPPAWTDVVFIGFMLGAAWLALKNVRERRADRRGAFRLAAFVFLMRMSQWAVAARHVLASAESTMFWAAIEESMFSAANVTAFYLAAEPYIRQRWPQPIQGWIRLLHRGRIWDSLVARQILVGIGAGAFVPAVAMTLSWLRSVPAPAATLDAALGIRPAVVLFIHQFGESLVFGIGFCSLFVLLRRWWREAVAAPIAIALIAYVEAQHIGSFYSLDALSAVVFAAVVLLMLRGWGLVAVVSFIIFGSLLLATPLTFRPAAWFWPTSLAVTLLIAGIGGWAAFASTRECRAVTNSGQYLSR